MQTVLWRLWVATWRSWFGPRVEPGQMWIFDDSEDRDNPFETGISFCVKVLDVKKGWVLFRRADDMTSSLRIGVFRFCYRFGGESR